MVRRESFVENAFKGLVYGGIASIFLGAIFGFNFPELVCELHAEHNPGEYLNRLLGTNLFPDVTVDQLNLKGAYVYGILNGGVIGGLSGLVGGTIYGLIKKYA